jgi:hypothetical protein
VKQLGSLDHLQIEVLSTVYVLKIRTFLPFCYSIVQIKIKEGRQ